MSGLDTRSRTQIWADEVAQTENIALESLMSRSHLEADSHGPKNVDTRSSRTPGSTARSISLSRTPPAVRDTARVDREQTPASLRSLLRAVTTLEHQVPLPESIGTSTPGDSVDSLALLQGVDTAAEFQIPLPQSTATSQNDAQRINSHADVSHTGRSAARASSHVETAPKPPPRTYWHDIAPLTRFLPHLRSIQPSYGRHKSVGRVTCIDYEGDNRRIADPLVVERLSHRRALYQQIQKLTVNENSSIESRLLLVEDLCPDLIAALGHTFGIGPEFFAEHLNRSGYDGVDYEEILPAKWKTSSMKKRHVSMTWFRPVYQNPRVTDWLKDPRLLLDKREIIDNEGRKVELSAITWTDPAHDSSGRVNKHAMAHRAVVDTNVFRRSWTLSARPTDGQTNNLATRYSDSESLSQATSDLIPTAWEERVSFYSCESASVPLAILLLDPLPAITDLQTRLHRKKPTGGASSVRSEPPSEKIDIAVPMAPRLAPDNLPNWYDATEDHVKDLEKAFNILRSTSEVIEEDSRWTKVQAASELHADPVLALLRVIENDTRLFFRSLEWTLDEISQDSLDDFLMTRRLSEWRKLMSDFEIQVPAIGKGLESFVNFVFRQDDGHELPEEVADLVESFNKDIQRIRTRLSEAYAALRADMQFTESRRSINEAKTVNRLTELAFIFIPLSFCASLFSMSIHELAEGVPIWTFVATALGMLAFAYAARFFISSEFLVNSTRRSLERFWSRKGVRRGDDAPVLTIIWFTMEELWEAGGSSLFWQAAGMLGLLAFPVIPVALMWKTTGMGAGFNSAITLLLLLPVLAVGGVRLFMSSDRYSSRWVHRQGDTSDSESGEDV